MERTKKKIDTTLQYFQYIIARIIIIGVIGFLINSVVIRKIDVIIFCSLLLIYCLFLLKNVFGKPTEISFNENFLYLKKETEPIDFKNIISVKKNLR